MKTKAVLISLSLILAGCGSEETETKSSSSSVNTEKSSETRTPEETGRIAFRACAVCHSVKDPAGGAAQNLAGPNLYGIIGAPAARLDNFAYSKALRESDIIWDEESLDAYIENPQKVIPGTRMAYAGERDAEKRAAMIAYLKSLD